MCACAPGAYCVPRARTTVFFFGGQRESTGVARSSRLVDCVSVARLSARDSMDGRTSGSLHVDNDRKRFAFTEQARCFPTRNHWSRIGAPPAAHKSPQKKRNRSKGKRKRKRSRSGGQEDSNGVHDFSSARSLVEISPQWSLFAVRRIGCFMRAHVARLVALCGGCGPMGAQSFDVGSARSRSGTGPHKAALCAP